MLALVAPRNTQRTLTTSLHISVDTLYCVSFEDGLYDTPTSCPESGCRGRTFQPDRDRVVTVDWQKLKLQEFGDDSAEPGRIPRTIEVEVTEDLVDVVVPGTFAVTG